MHPILLRIPLPHATVKLWWALAVAALVAVAYAGGAYRKQQRTTGAGALFAAAAIAAVAYAMRAKSFELGPIPIYSYGVMLGLSLVVGWYLTLGLAERDGLPKEAMANCYVVTAIAAIVGSRLLYVVTNLDEFKTFGDLFALRRGGLVAYGGFLGGFFGSLFYLRRYKLRLLPWADVAVPSLASGLLVTRIGCYLFGCDFGKPLPGGAPEWLKKLGTFPHWPEGTLEHGAGSPAWVQHVQHRGLSFDAAASYPVHPTQLYESLTGLLLLLLLLAVRKRQSFRGQVFLVFAFAYGAARFLLEIIRDDAERGEYGPRLAEHVVVTGSLAAMAAAYALGIAQSVKDPTLRRLTQIVAFVPAAVAYMVLRPPTFAEQTLVQLSTSQWIGAGTAVLAGVFYRVYNNAALLHPEAAMSLGIEEAAAAPEPAAAETKRAVPAPKAEAKKETAAVPAAPAPAAKAATDEGEKDGPAAADPPGGDAPAPKEPA